MNKKPLITTLTLGFILLLSAFHSATYAGTFTAFGSRTFVRGTGQPFTETASFNIKNPNTSYTLHVYNGGINSELTRVSSAVIKLNGSTIFDANDFNQQIAHIQKQVDVTKSNLLEVELRSIPNSGLTILLEGVDNDPPIVNIISPQDGSTIKTPKPDIALEYSDALSGIDLSTVRLMLDGLDITAEAAITEVGITYISQAPLRDGTHTVTASVSDKAGNATVVSSTFTIQLDRCSTVKLPLNKGQRPFIFPEPAIDAGPYYPYGQVSYWDTEVNDLNRDGILDMVVKNYISGRGGMSVMLGKGDGSFESPINFGEAAGGTVFNIAVADFNEDCFPDIATIVYLSSYSYQFKIFLNNGDGTFAQGMTSAINTLGEILTGDFNKDTYKDIAIMGFYGKLLVFQGKGDGSFSGQTEVTIGDSLTMIDSISADFNKDGIIDIAATVVYRDYELTKVVLLTGNGDGTFQAPKVLISEVLDTGKLSILVGLAAEDINMDGIPDILVSTSGHGDYPSGLAVLIGDGSGGFLRKPDLEFNLEMDCLPIRVKDFNGDGVPDIAIRGYSTNSKVYILKVYILIGNGDGTFKYPMMFNISGYDLNTGDFDNDGAEDLISTKDHVFVLFAKGDGTFIDRKTIATTALSADISAADFDGNNTPDIARAGGGNYEGLLFSTILNRDNEWGQSVFQGDKVYRVGDGPAIVRIKDLNGDGRADIVTANDLSTDISVVLNNGNGLNKTASYQIEGQPVFVAVDDLNGDVFPEIVTADKNSENITIFMNGGDGSFQTRNRYTTGSKPLAIAVGDYNGDGRQDIAVADSSRTVSILFGNRDNTFEIQAISVFDGLTLSSIVKGDFNNDGIMDLLVNGYSYSSWQSLSQVILLIGKGDGSFTKKYVSLEGGGWNPIVMDTNKDGKLDLIPLNRVAVYTGDGNGQFQKGQQLEGLGAARAVTIGDLNNDGIMDILYVPNNDNASLGIWLGQGNGTFRQGTYIGGWEDVRSVDIGDIDGDGIADIALSDYKDLHVIYGNGNGAFPGESTLYGRLNNGYLEKGVYLATADFNADHNQDIVVNYGSPFDLNKIGIYWGTGYNTFMQGPVLDIPGDFGGPVYTDDLNKDGLPDIIFAQHPWDGKAILTFFNNGDGTFKEAVSYNIGPTRWWPVFEDINKDGHRDIVTIEEQFINQWNSSYSIVIHSGKGDGAFQYSQTVPLESKPSRLVVQDFNGDGFPDVATAVKYGTSWFSYKIEVFINNGDGTFSSFSTNIDGVPLLAEDFNHDGKMDLIVVDGSQDAFALLLGNGDGTFKPSQHYSAGYGSFGWKIVSRDFNQDGRQDIVIAYGNSSGYLDLIFNTLPPLRTPPLPPKKLTGKAGDGTASLSWAANTEEDIAGYNVYRSLSAGGGYVKLNSTTVSSLTYTDSTAANGTTYYYTVSAIDKDGDESSYAFKVKVTPNPPDTTPPVVKINNPVNGGTVYSPKLFVLGAINETDSKVAVNGISGTIQKNDNTFTAYDIPLSAGENTITVTAVDAAGNSSIDSIKVVYVPTASISGVVKDEFTGQPVQWASVYITDSEKTQNLSTGADGRYFFGKVIPGEVTIMVDSSNYDRITLSKTLSSGEALNFDILMPLTPARLSGTVYNASNYWGIGGATITVTDRKKTQSVTTYNWGGYEVTGIAPYDVTITVSKPGYETYTETRTLSNRWTNWRYYYLKQLLPSIPTGLAATSGGGYITLTWDQSLEDLDGYNIYRSTTPGSGYVKLNSYPEYYTSYKDTNVAPGATYYYVITAVNTSSQESGYSAEASAAPRDVFPPTALTAMAGEGFVELNWNPSADNDISSYKIYRSTESGAGYSYITTASGTYYKDKSVTGGTTYYYVATAVNTISKESPYSNEASATPEELKLSVSITYPKDGEWLKNSRIIVRGTVETASNEAGVVIETGDTKSGASARYLAQVNGREFAAVVNLPEGFSYIKAIATDGTGNRAETSVIVSSMHSSEMIRLTADPESGIMTLKIITSPYPTKEGFPMPEVSVMDVTLEAETYLPDPVTSYSWDFNGDGRPEQVGTMPEITASYYSPGLYFPTVTVTDSQGNTYTATTVVNILSKDAIDALLKGKWEGMKEALANQDTAKALNYLDDSIKVKFSRVFTDLGSDLAAISESLEEITMNDFNGDVAEYVTRRSHGNARYTYFIYFMKDSNGFWKIKGM